MTGGGPRAREFDHLLSHDYAHVCTPAGRSTMKITGPHLKKHPWIEGGVTVAKRAGSGEGSGILRVPFHRVRPRSRG